MAGTKKSTPSKDIVVGCLSFGKPGPANTERTLEAAARRAAELGVRNVLVATTTGRRPSRPSASSSPPGSWP
jgi:hypothetical protein